MTTTVRMTPTFFVPPSSFACKFGTKFYFLKQILGSGDIIEGSVFIHGRGKLQKAPKHLPPPTLIGVWILLVLQLINKAKKEEKNKCFFFHLLSALFFVEISWNFQKKAQKKTNVSFAFFFEDFSDFFFLWVHKGTLNFRLCLFLKNLPWWKQNLVEEVSSD